MHPRNGIDPASASVSKADGEADGKAVSRTRVRICLRGVRRSAVGGRCCIERSSPCRGIGGIHDRCGGVLPRGTRSLFRNGCARRDRETRRGCLAGLAAHESGVQGIRPGRERPGCFPRVPFLRQAGGRPRFAFLFGISRGMRPGSAALRRQLVLRTDACFLLQRVLGLPRVRSRGGSDHRRLPGRSPAGRQVLLFRKRRPLHRGAGNRVLQRHRADVVRIPHGQQDLAGAALAGVDASSRAQAISRWCTYRRSTR